MVVHGDAEGADTLRRSLADWLQDMHLVPAGYGAIDRYVGYYEPYATSHEALDRDEALQGEVSEAAKKLIAAVRRCRAAPSRGEAARTGRELRPK